MKNLIWDSRSPGQDLNPGPLEYEAEMLNTRPRRSVLICDLIGQPAKYPVVSYSSASWSVR
jgi:hypothetical protein